ncbi:ATP-binding protein [Streptomyces sp. NPDC020096]
MVRTGQPVQPGQMHAVTLPTVPDSVRIARRTTAVTMAEFDVPVGSSFVDAAMLIVSELVTNAVRHAAKRSPSVAVVITVRVDQVVLEVADEDPRIPDLDPGTTGEGLRTVVELAAEWGGEVRVEPPLTGKGKIMRVTLPLPRGR